MELKLLNSVEAIQSACGLFSGTQVVATNVPGRTSFGGTITTVDSSPIVNVIGSPFIRMHGVSEQFRIPSPTYMYFFSS